MQNVDKLIIAIVRKHHISEEHNLFNDVVQDAKIAVLKHKRGWRKSKGQFTTYIYHHIRKAVQNYLARNLCEISYPVYETMLVNKAGLVKLNTKTDPEKINILPSYLNADFQTPLSSLCLKEKHEALDKINELLERLTDDERMVMKLTILRQHSNYTQKERKQIVNYAKRNGWSKSTENCLQYNKYRILRKLRDMIDE